MRVCVCVCVCVCVWDIGFGGGFLKNHRMGGRVANGEWRVTVYGVLFGELRLLDSHTTQLSELYWKPNLGELAVNGNGNSPNR